MRRTLPLLLLTHGVRAAAGCAGRLGRREVRQDVIVATGGDGRPDGTLSPTRGGADRPACEFTSSFKTFTG